MEFFVLTRKPTKKFYRVKFLKQQYSNLFQIFKKFVMCVCGIERHRERKRCGVAHAMVHTWRWENSPGESVFSFHHGLQALSSGC